MWKFSFQDEKASSERSFKLSGDDIEPTSSFSKRNRLSQQSRNSTVAAGPPETDQLILNDSTKDTDSSLKDAAQTPTKQSLNLDPPAPSTDTTNQANASNTQPKNLSKAAVLRQLFFSQPNPNNTVDTPQIPRESN